MREAETLHLWLKGEEMGRDEKWKEMRTYSAFCSEHFARGKKEETEAVRWEEKEMRLDENHLIQIKTSHLEHFTRGKREMPRMS